MAARGDATASLLQGSSIQLVTHHLPPSRTRSGRSTDDPHPANRNELPLNKLRSQEDGTPVTLGYTPDQMPVVVWPRGDDPVLEVGCVQIRLFRLTEGLRAALTECLERGTRVGS